MVTPAERGLESPTVGRACTLVQAERDAAATQVEKSMDEEKSMEGGGCTPGWYCAGPSAICPTSERPGRERGHPGKLSSWPRLPGSGAPTCHGPLQLYSSRGEGETPMVAGRQGRDPCQHVSGTRDDGAYTPGWLRGANRRYEYITLADLKAHGAAAAARPDRPSRGHAVLARPPAPPGRYVEHVVGRSVRAQHGAPHHQQLYSIHNIFTWATPVLRRRDGHRRSIRLRG